MISCCPFTLSLFIILLINPLLFSGCPLVGSAVAAEKRQERQNLRWHFNGNITKSVHSHLDPHSNTNARSLSTAAFPHYMIQPSGHYHQRMYHHNYHNQSVHSRQPWTVLEEVDGLRNDEVVMVVLSTWSFDGLYLRERYAGQLFTVDSYF